MIWIKALVVDYTAILYGIIIVDDLDKSYQTPVNHTFYTQWRKHLP